MREQSEIFEVKHRWNGCIFGGLLLHLKLLPFGQPLGTFPSKCPRFSIVSLSDVMLNPRLSTFLFLRNRGLSELILLLGCDGLAFSGGTGHLGDDDEGKQEDDDATHELQGAVVSAQERYTLVIVGLEVGV